MKKTICVILTLLLTAGFIACGRGQESSESKMHSLIVRDQANKDAVVNLNEADEKTILGYINSVNDWSDGLCDCSSDYTFEFYKGETLTKINYSFYGGCLNDVTNQRSCNLSDEAREGINRILAGTMPIPKDEFSTESKDESSNEPKDESSTEASLEASEDVSDEVSEDVSEDVSEESNSESSESDDEESEPYEYFENGIYTSRVTHCKIGDFWGGIALTRKRDAEYIVNLLKNGKWKKDLHKCTYDRSVHVEENAYKYSSQCGCFLDEENGKTLAIKTGSSDHKRLNSIFNVYFYEMGFTVRPAYNENIVMKFSEEDHETLWKCVITSQWTEGTSDCAPDYIFETDEGGWITRYGYHTSCGTINNYTDGLSYQLSESYREKINRILENTPKDLDE